MVREKRDTTAGPESQSHPFRRRPRLQRHRQRAHDRPVLNNESIHSHYSHDSVVDRILAYQS